MHELGVVFHCIEQINSIAAENNVEKVRRVTVEIGEVSTVIPHLFEDVWKWAVKKEDILRGCELDIQIIDALTHCDECGTDYPTVKHGKICPKCGSGKTWLIQGNEMVIKELEIE